MLNRSFRTKHSLFRFESNCLSQNESDHVQLQHQYDLVAKLIQFEQCSALPTRKWKYGCINSTSSQLSQPGWFINCLMVVNRFKPPKCASKMQHCLQYNLKLTYTKKLLLEAAIHRKWLQLPLKERSSSALKASSYQEELFRS